MEVTKFFCIDALAVSVKLWHYARMQTEDMLSQAVTEAESGQKILQFLERRLKLPPNLLHRWIRTGQVRLNGGRCKPFGRVKTGDMVRLPPFAFKLAAQMLTPMPASDRTVPPLLPLPPFMGTGRGPYRGLVAYAKPRGLPTHPGTGHDDSLASRLASHYRDNPFVPVPVHRLDKDTSGLLLVATSHGVLRQAHDDWREGRIAKEYLAWVEGRWPFAETQMFRHMLHREGAPGREKMKATLLKGATPQAGPLPMGGSNAREARTLVTPLRILDDTSLLLLRILTGRTHQIRAQLASLGFPVLGDGKYGSTTRTHLHLHACRLTLADGTVFGCLPDWEGARAVTALPERVAVPDSL